MESTWLLSLASSSEVACLDLEESFLTTDAMKLFLLRRHQS